MCTALSPVTAATGPSMGDLAAEMKHVIAVYNLASGVLGQRCIRLLLRTFQVQLSLSRTISTQSSYSSSCSRWYDRDEYLAEKSSALTEVSNHAIEEPCYVNNV